MFKSYPITSRFLLFFVAPVIAFAVTGWIFLRFSLPVSDGQTIRTSVVDRVTITRDNRGVVYVNARVDRDAFFALGFAHAQDRMWQLELERRISQGRLSEIFGSAGVQQDVWMRTLGIYDSARASWPTLSEEAKRSLTAYAAGINAWLKTDHVLPPEFLILDVKPEPWSELDSLAWQKVFALSLALNFRNEITNLITSQHLSENQLHDLWRTSAEKTPEPATARVFLSATVADGMLALEKQLQNALKIGGFGVGSNAWVVSGKCTEGGDPILANDTHLGLQIPSLWYVAHLQGDRLNTSGMTLVGLPLVIFGRNEKIAWGGTNMMADVQDLYVEELNPQRPSQYRQNDRWEDFDVHTEIINVKANFPSSLRAVIPPIRIQVRKTKIGPIVSDAIGAMDQPIALRWTGLESGDTSYESFYRLNYAHDWLTFKKALSVHVAPALNMLYADNSGNIGFIGAGRIPIRSIGQGRLPVPGWNTDYRWDGYIPFELLPQQYNPDNRCYLTSANNKNTEDHYPYFISDNWALPARAQRIAQLLDQNTQQGRKISIDFAMQMQGDTTDLSAINLLPLLSNVAVAGQQHTLAIRYLAKWDGNMARDSQAAAIFFTWTKFLRKHLFGVKLTGYWNKPEQAQVLNEVVQNTTNDQILYALTKSDEWCSRTNTGNIQSCDYILKESLNEAVIELTKLRGPSISNWHWGDIHSTLYGHLPFSEMKPLGPIFERRIPNGGSQNSINVANSDFRESLGYEQTTGAGFRQIMYMGSRDSPQYYMNSTGQSGNVLSSHYDDMVKPFRDIQLYKILDQSTLRPTDALILAPE